jgi:Cd2+/Zn2+-exporting ATPase
MMDLVERLTRLGFGEWEAKVYLALLQRSPANGYQVSKDSAVPRSMVYEVLGKLVGRGAVLMTHDGDNTLYAPVPPTDLMERLQREHSELTDGLKRDLAQVSKGTEEEYVWRIDGYDSVLARAWKLIESAKKTLHAQLYADEFERLRPALAEAAARGVQVALATIGEVDFPAGRVVELPVTDAYAKAATFALLLVADTQEVLLGERRAEAEARASWTRNRQLAAIVEGHVRRTLLIPVLYEKLGVDEVLEAMPETERALMQALVDREKVERVPEKPKERPRRWKGA